MLIDTTYLEKLLHTLRYALIRLNQTKETDLDYDVYRHAVIKEFELILETSGKLLRKALKHYGANPREIDELFYNEVFRRCAKHGLLEVDLVERWFIYRLNRNNTTHDYGLGFVTSTLSLLPEFINDVDLILRQLNHKFGPPPA